MGLDGFDSLDLLKTSASAETCFQMFWIANAGLCLRLGASLSARLTYELAFLPNRDRRSGPTVSRFHVTGSKRRSPSAAELQPAAKKGRLLKQSYSPIKDATMKAASEDDSADEVVSPKKRGRKRLVESDDDEDFQPGQQCGSHSH